MKMRRFGTGILFCAGLLTWVFLASGRAEAADSKKLDYPTKGRAITIIVPFAPGGANDIAARLQAPALERELGVPVVVVNKPGASTQVGMTQLVQAKPDGHTLGLLTLPGAMQAYLDPSRKAIYSRKDFTVVALQSWDPNGLAVKVDSPYKNLKDLVAAAQANPEKIKMGTSGLLSTDHMVLLLLQKAAGVKFAIAHFDGGSQSIATLLGGHLDAVVTTSSTFIPQLKSGKVRMLGITDEEEDNFFPGVKTFEAQGYKVRYGASRGIVVRSDTPRDVLTVLGAAVKAATDDPDVRKRMNEMALTVRYMDEKQAGAFWDELEAQTRPLLALAK
jgi:tripartite-type tricarboxylate transporter receptor subunit TctC